MIWGHIAFIDVASAAFTKSESEIVKVDLQPTEKNTEEDQRQQQVQFAAPE